MMEKLWIGDKMYMVDEEVYVEIERLKSIILRYHPKHRHDHDYFHDDCALCRVEKIDWEEISGKAGE